MLGQFPSFLKAVWLPIIALSFEHLWVVVLLAILLHILIFIRIHPSEKLFQM